MATAKTIGEERGTTERERERELRWTDHVETGDPMMEKNTLYTVDPQWPQTELSRYLKNVIQNMILTSSFMFT